MEFIRCVIHCLSIVVWVSAFPYYQEKIPNGDKVPNPCRVYPFQSEYYPAVGHYKISPKPRNKFGQDFNAVLHDWSVLCRMDSDDDGWTNGEELGDENCLWDPTNKTTDSYLTEAKSHPGVKENEITAKDTGNSTGAPDAEKTIRIPDEAELLLVCGAWPAWK